MSYLARLRAKISPEGATPELTKLTKAGYGSFVSASPAASRQNSAANDDTEPAQDLPLLAALAEFDALIDRLCELSKHPPEVREEMRRVRYGMAPCNVPRELEEVRELVRRAESRAANHPPAK